jgi:hypothetical protein
LGRGLVLAVHRVCLSLRSALNPKHRDDPATIVTAATPWLTAMKRSRKARKRVSSTTSTTPQATETM